MTPQQPLNPSAGLTRDDICRALRFYFITDDGAADFPPLAQVQMAIDAGATMIQYRNKAFSLDAFEEVVAICRLCRRQGVPFVVNDNILLARAVGADGVHLGQDDPPPAWARRILEPGAIVGLTVSNLGELARSDLSVCDYIGTGPVFPTGTKADAKPVRGLEGLAQIVGRSPLPVTAIGGIDPHNAGQCLARGAAGVAVISCLTRVPDPRAAAAALAQACGVEPRQPPP